MKNDTVFDLLVKSLNNDERSICLIFHCLKCLRFCYAYKIKKSFILPVMRKLVWRVKEGTERLKGPKSEKKEWEEQISASWGCLTLHRDDHHRLRCLETWLKQTVTSLLCHLLSNFEVLWLEMKVWCLSMILYIVQWCTQNEEHRSTIKASVTVSHHTAFGLEKFVGNKKSFSFFCFLMSQRMWFRQMLIFFIINWSKN